MRFADTLFRLLGATSGETILKGAAAASGTITLPAGTTDFSATGGASQVVRQSTPGGALTVSQLVASDVTGALSGNQTITLSGDIAGSGATAITTTLPNVNANTGTFQGITVNAKGQVTAAANQSYLTSTGVAGMTTGQLPVAASATTITSSVPYGTTGNNTVVQTGGTGVLAAGVLPAYTGDVTSPAGGTVNTLAAVNSNVGTFQGLTVNAKGLVTAAANQSYAPLASPTFTGTASAPSMTVTSNGTGSYNFYDRTVSTTQWSLYAAGGVAYLYNTVAAANSLSLDTSGNLTIAGGTAIKPGGGSWTAPSDRALKSTTADWGTGLAAVLALNPIAYRYNIDEWNLDNTDHIGLDASDAASVIPEMARKVMLPRPDLDSPPLEAAALDHTPLTFALLNAVKELATRVEALETKLEAAA